MTTANAAVTGENPAATLDEISIGPKSTMFAGASRNVPIASITSRTASTNRNGEEVNDSSHCSIAAIVAAFAGDRH